MKLCPNEACPHRRRVGRPAEYVEGTESCADCGAALVEELPVEESPPAAARGRAPLRPLLVTLVGAAVPFLLALLPIPGVDREALGSAGMDVAKESFSLAALGLMPVISAFQLVELVALVVPRLRPLRTSGPEPRVRLFAASLGLAALLAAVQAYFIAVWLEGAGYPFTASVVDEPGWGFRLLAIASLVSGTLAMVGAALLISRFGLGSGFAVLLGASMVAALVEGGEGMLQRLVIGEVPPLKLLLWLAAVGGLVYLAALVLRLPDRRKAGVEVDPVLSALRLPTCGWIPITWAASVMMAPSVVASFYIPVEVLARGLERLTQLLVPGSVPYLVLSLVMVAGFGLAFSQLFYRPDLVAATLRRGEEPHLRQLLWRRSLLSLALLGGAMVAQHVLSGWGLLINTTAAVYIAAVALDLGSEWRACRATTEPLLKVWELHRLYAVERARAVLVEEGLTPCFKGLYFRALLHFFGPYVPVDVLVPEPQAARGRELLEAALLPPSAGEGDA